jgi:cyanophycinase-like exopeptidase
VGQAINQRIREGVPVGGSSAGLAVLGEFSFSAEHDSITSKQALANPYDPAVAIETDFLHIPILKGVITDTHWVKRDRQGRTLVFLARLVADGKARPASAIAVDEGNAVLLEAGGEARVSGPGSAYFLRTTTAPAVCEAGKPLTFAGIEVYRIAASGRFDVKNWRGEGGTAYRLDVEQGTVRSTQTGGGVY